MDEEILNALLKRAKGYSYKEVQEEYAVKDDGEIALTKRKVLEKYCPPDSSALKTYMELNGDKDVRELSDEELEKEKMRLLKELEMQEKEIYSKNLPHKTGTFYGDPYGDVCGNPESNAGRKEKSKRTAKK